MIDIIMKTGITLFIFIMPILIIFSILDWSKAFLCGFSVLALGALMAIIGVIFRIWGVA